MARDSFFDDAAKARTTSAIRRIEEQTAAEVVVAVRPRAAWYLPTTVTAGAVAGVVAFLVMWFSPVVYDVRTIPLDVALTFLLVALVVHVSDICKRFLTPRSFKARATRALAQKVFAELGIDRTRDRTGMLVCVSWLERDVALVADEGIARSGVASEFLGIETALADAVRSRDVSAFVEALGRLGPVLGARLPRRDDDSNELSDTVA
jgi:putative membrane protein